MFENAEVGWTKILYAAKHADSKNEEKWARLVTVMSKEAVKELSRYISQAGGELKSNALDVAIENIERDGGKRNRVLLQLDATVAEMIYSRQRALAQKRGRVVTLNETVRELFKESNVVVHRHIFENARTGDMFERTSIGTIRVEKEDIQKTSEVKVHNLEQEHARAVQAAEKQVKRVAKRRRSGAPPQTRVMENSGAE